jgi:hypothetical protein
MITFPISFLQSASGPPPLDPDAATYLAAVTAAGGTVTPTITDAINNLFLGLKADGVYSLLWSMFPLVGGTQSSHAINALNPGSRNLVFTGSWTHTSQGAQGINDSDTAAKTGYVPQAQGGLTDTCFGWYNNFATNLDGEKYIGMLNNVGPQRWMGVQLSSGRVDWGADSRTFVSISDGQTGMYILSGAISPPKVFADRYTTGGLSTSSGDLNPDPLYAVLPYELYFGALNLDDSVYGTTNQRFAFYFISSGMIPQQRADMANRINICQTALGRNSY